MGGNASGFDKAARNASNADLSPASMVGVPRKGTGKGSPPPGSVVGVPHIGPTNKSMSPGYTVVCAHMGATYKTTRSAKAHTSLTEAMASWGKVESSK